MAGVVDFDPEKWSLANAAEQSAKVANLAKARPKLAGLATLAVPPLPTDVRTGLARLRAMPRPRMAQPENWGGIVSDCVGLAAQGWAQAAIALGWSPLNLWGVSPAAGCLLELEGLGIWLARRRVLLLDQTSCIVESGPHRRSIFHRHQMEGAVLLWDLRERGKAGASGFARR